MNVSVTPELEKFVHDLVASGRYHSASEVFRDGLRLLEEAERRRLLEKWVTEGLTASEESRIPPGLIERARVEIRSKIQEGLDALDRGEVIDADEFFARLESRLDTPARKACGEPSKTRKA